MTTTVEPTTDTLEAKGAAADDAAEMAERQRRGRLAVDGDGPLCVVAHDGRVTRPVVGAVEYMAASIVGNAPRHVFQRARRSDEQLAKRPSYRATSLT
jgi:hypothetical protein